MVYLFRVVMSKIIRYETNIINVYIFHINSVKHFLTALPDLFVNSRKHFNQMLCRHLLLSRALKSFVGKGRCHQLPTIFKSNEKCTVSSIFNTCFYFVQSTPSKEFEKYGQFIIITRGYAKGKDKKKDTKGKKKVVINEHLLNDVINVEKLQTDLKKCVENLKIDFVKHLTIRSSVGALDTLKVNHEGQEYTLQELAQIVKKNPKTIVVNMINFPQAIQDVLKALQQSGLGLNPQQDGTTLYIPIPKVTKEHRENLSKNAKAIFVKHRDFLKDVQNKYLKTIKSKDDISEDLAFSARDQVIAMTDQQVSVAEELLKLKQKELLGEEK